MKRSIIRITLAVLLLALPQSVFGKELIPGGQVVGLELTGGAVTVAAFPENSRAQEAGVQVGDRILRLNGQAVTTAGEIRQALDRSQGSVELELLRNGETLLLTVFPEPSDSGPRLGIYLRQGITGIGTVTWYDPQTGSFGALGHGVTDSSGELLCLRQGSIYRARVASVRRGRAGEPGQLMGALESPAPIGSLTKNTSQGVFGKTEPLWSQPMEIASRDQVQTGNATILSTVDASGVQEYSVQILKIYPNARKTGRNLLIKITDPALLNTTSGIVQGMSGSPILQNGRIVGAVTHVLVNDPTTGYGIFIENMLDAAA